MAKTVEANAPRKARSQMGEVWHQFRRNKGAMIGSAIVLIIVFIALFADVFLDYDTQVVGQNVAERLQWPRDVYKRQSYCRASPLSIRNSGNAIGPFCMKLTTLGHTHATIFVLY